MTGKGDKGERVLARIIHSSHGQRAENELRKISLPEAATSNYLRNLDRYVIRIDKIRPETANALETHAISNGCAAIKGTSINEYIPVVISGDTTQFELLLETASSSLKAACEAIIEGVLNYKKKDFSVPCPGGELLLGDKTAIMGIINVTPDSFSDGGDNYDFETAVESAFRMVQDDAAIIDVGGESTRPGSDAVSAKEELSRVIPVIEKLAPALDIPISIDTCKPEVAKHAIAAGARIINDVTGLRNGTAMAELAADAGVPVIVMHMKGEPKTMQKNPRYEDLVLEIYESLAESTSKALSFGIDRDRIIIDPGIGFGKTIEDNLVIINRLGQFRSLGLPICIGASRKAFIGATLGLREPGERLFGSLSAAVRSAEAGAKVIRVHDVKETVQAIRLAEAVSKEKTDVES